MAANSVFDKLVSGLSSGERRDMLRRIASSATSPKPVPPAHEEAAIDLDEEYAQLGPLRRLIVLLVALFTGRERLSVVEGHLLRDLGRRVNSVLPHGLDVSGQQLRPGAVEDLRKLAGSSRQFSAVLARAMGRERKAFVAFLAGLHAPEPQARLEHDTDPFRIGAAQPELSESDVRRRSMNEIDDVTATLPPATRQRIYTDVRALHQLMTLSSFPFDRIITVFQPVPGGEPVAAPLSRIVDDLARLAAIFEGLRQDPSPVLFQSLGLFQEQDRLGEDDQAVETLVRERIDALVAAYNDVRAFERHYPLSDLVRIAHNNIHFRPTAPSGGEDWYAQWKSFWRERADEANRRYAYQRRIDATIGTARTTLGLDRVEPFPGYPPSGLDEPARHGLSAGILRLVMEQVVEDEVSAPVAVLYRDGEFYKADNRADMDRAWQNLQRLRTDVANLEVRLRPTGDLGMSWAQTLDRSIPADEARERQLVLVATIDSDASALLHRAVDVFRLLGDILQGVLYGTVGGRYDTISNLAQLGGRSTNGFAAKLEAAHVRCKAAADVLTDLQNVETSVQRA